MVAKASRASSDISTIPKDMESAGKAPLIRKHYLILRSSSIGRGYEGTRSTKNATLQLR